MRTLEELTTDTNVTSWVPADAYADLILEDSVCYGQLSGVITAIDYDLKACQGDTIQVRYVPARTAQGPKNACECLSAVSSTMGTFPITVHAYGDYDLMCGLSLFKACGPVKEMVLREMSKGLAKLRDEEVWDAICDDVHPGYEADLKHAWNASVVTDACCFDAVDLYNKIVYVYKQMQGGAMNPDYVIMHPEVAAHLYYKDNGHMPFAGIISPLMKFDGNGQLVSIGPLKVIECCNAQSGSTVSGTTLAVIIDSTRAVGEAWGKRPKFYEFFEVDCDRYKETVWMYWGCATMDTHAIGHVLNP